MSDVSDKKAKYYNILSRIQKKYSIYEGLFIIKKQYLTNNSFYYFLCLFFRFIYIILMSGDYEYTFRKGKSRINTFQNYLRKLTCLNLVQQLNLSYKMYLIIIFIILAFSLINFKLKANIVTNLHKYKSTYKWPIPSKYQIINEHVYFLLFPFIIEYLSFSYYMYFFPDKFIIKCDTKNQKILLIFIMIINTILIILYNIDNYIDIVCSNRLFTITIFEADSYAKENKVKKNKMKPISYRCSNLFLYILIYLQNFVIFSMLGNYINMRLCLIYKIIISIILLLTILTLFVNQMNEFNYNNFINLSFNTFIFFCFYSILLDLILFLSRYRMKNQKNQIIYELIKLFLSIISNLVFIMKNYIFLESKITEILFQEKNNKKEKQFLNCFFYLHEIMIKIKEQNEVESAFFLIKFLNKHINNCNKMICDCKLFDIYLKKNNSDLNKEELKDYLNELINILNYLFECSFVEYDFYNNYDISILLAEHFCHLRNNPTMSFSIITTLILKKRNQFSKFEMVVLYELSQKYIYYIIAKVKSDFGAEIENNKLDLLKNQLRQNEFIDYYYNLTLSNKAKKLIANYIDNEMKILKYKIIFEDSLSFQFDENNENILSVKINFFKQFINIDNLYNEYDNKNIKKNKRDKEKKNGSNLYNIIYLLNKEYIYYRKIIYSISQIQINKDIPINMIFKYILFFDMFIGGKIPEQVINKLYGCFKSNTNIYNSTITESEFNILKRKYKEKNNMLGSKTYVIVEFKKELRTKYFTEDGLLKLGYQQKDIINEKIDLLMPKDFCNSHKNAIKKLIIGNQVRYSVSKQSYYFDKSSSVLYSSNFEGSLIYNISKSLIMMLESTFNFENQYRFMLNNNFELLACSRNFEDEYHLNQKILQSYNIKLFDILKIKQEKLNQKFEKEYKYIQYQKYIRQIKPEEYFIPGFYITPEDKIASMVNQAYFSSSKNNILSKISNSNNHNGQMNYQEDKDDEDKKLIEKEKFNNSLSDLFVNPSEVIFHKTYNLSLNKASFIENLAKELIKIPENDLMFENDKTSYNLITLSKQLISKLLTKNELSNHLMKMTIKFSFYYDKPFYFITIDDQKKLYLNISKTIHFQNSHNISDKKLPSKTKNSIPHNKSIKKSRNKSVVKSMNLPGENENNKDKNQLNLDKKKNNNYSVSEDKTIILNIIKENRTKINKDKFISIIKSILSITIICILVIYLIISEYQKSLAKIMEENLLAYYYNLYTRDLLIGVESSLLRIYYDWHILQNNSTRNYLINLYILGNLTTQLKEKYHNFTDYFFDYNLHIDHDFNLLYKKKQFIKLRGFWKKITYESKYASELDFIMYNIFSFISKDLDKIKIQKDFDNLLFLKGQEKKNEKIYTPFIKVLYYVCLNYELVYRDLFTEISDSIYDSYKNYVNKSVNNYVLLEIFGLLLYILFFVTSIIFLYNSNNIIIKNIIFLFLDFSEKQFEKNKLINNNIIKYKLMEFQYIIDDFDMSLFNRFSKNIDNINKNKYINTHSDLAKNKSINTNNNNNLNEMNNLGINESNKKLPNKKSNKNLIINALGDANNLNGKTSLFSELKNREISNSSHNYLEESNSQFSKDKLNNNSLINSSKDFLMNNSKDYANNKNMKIIDNNSERNNDLKKAESVEQENYQDILLNKSNKSLVFMIKIFFIIIIILIVIVISFISFKFKYILSFNQKFNKFFGDITILTDRYSIAYYYFNTLRILMVLPDNSSSKLMYSNVMETINLNFESENKKYINLLSSNIKDYKEINKLFNVLKETKDDKFDEIKQIICSQKDLCEMFLTTNKNFLHSGVDFAFKTTITEIYNIYMDYKKLANKENMDDIKSSIIFSRNSQFIKIGLSLSYFFIYVEEKIFSCFEQDERYLDDSYINMMNILNFSSIIISILIFLFIIFFIFISISNFSEPIKDSSYRIHCSFLHIKKYNITSYRKIDSNLTK